MSKKRLAGIIAGCIVTIIVVIVIAGCQGDRISILNPYQLTDNRYKVQLHAHTMNSDGADSPAVLATAYKNAGYDALAITDHNYLTPDPGASGILHINGVEESTSLEHRQHIVNLFAVSEKSRTTLQDVIDKILLDNALACIAHPSFGGVYTDTLQQLLGYQLIEIATTTETAVGQAVDEAAWDFLLTRERHVWAIGVDDCHDISGSEFNKYFVEIMADELTTTAIKDSLKNGNFYVRQTGAPQITVTVSNTTVTCNSSTPMNIQFIGMNSTVLKTENGVTQSTYTLQGWEQYVRIKAVDNATATYYTWSQPVWILGT